MLLNWYFSTNRVPESFTITLNATITNINTASPFFSATNFLLVVSDPCLATTWDNGSGFLSVVSFTYNIG